MIFGRNVAGERKQSKHALFSHLNKLVLLHYLAEQGNCSFSLKCCITALKGWIVGWDLTALLTQI